MMFLGVTNGHLGVLLLKDAKEESNNECVTPQGLARVATHPFSSLGDSVVSGAWYLGEEPLGLPPPPTPPPSPPPTPAGIWRVFVSHPLGGNMRMVSSLW